MKKLLVLALIAACDTGEHRAARDKYNEGVALLAKGELDSAEKALLDARSQAGVDPELRFRAAYDLGFAYDAHAQATKTGKDADLSKALELEDQAVTWFSDAARLKKDDTDTQENLAIARARAQAISDELRKGEGKLEKRLDAVIAQHAPCSAVRARPGSRSRARVARTRSPSRARSPTSPISSAASSPRRA